MEKPSVVLDAKSSIPALVVLSRFSSYSQFINDPKCIVVDNETSIFPNTHDQN